MSTGDQNARLSGTGTLLMAITAIFSFFSLFTLLFPSSSLVVMPFSFMFSALSLVGFILFMVGMKSLSVRYRTPAIFDNVLYGLLSAIVGGVAVGIIGVVVAFVNISSVFRSLAPFTPGTNIMDAPGAFGGIFIPIVIAALVVGLITAIFYRRAFNLLAEKSGIKRFRTVGLLYLISIILIGVLMLVGAILVAINTVAVTTMFTLILPVNIITCAAFVLATLGFFSIKAAPYQAPAYAPSYQYATPQVKYCTYCGAPNRLDSAYCANCGKPTKPT